MNNKSINIGEAISYGWALINKDFWYIIGITAISMIPSVLTSGKDTPAMFHILGYALSILLTCGYTKLLLSYSKGKKMPIGEMFNQTKYFWRYLGASLLIMLIIVIIPLLFIVPGFYLAVRYSFVPYMIIASIIFIIPAIYLSMRYMFAPYFIIDKDMGVIESMNHSAQITKDNIMSLIGFNIVCMGVMLLGVIAFLVGVLAAMPVATFAIIYIYRKLLKK